MANPDRSADRSVQAATGAGTTSGSFASLAEKGDRFIFLDIWLFTPHMQKNKSVPFFLLRAGAADEAAGQRARVFAVLQHLLAVHEDLQHAGRVLVRLVEGRVVDDLVRIEHDDV